MAYTGILKPTYAPALSDIVSTTVELWRDAVLGSRSDDPVAASRNWARFNGAAKILNTILLLAVLPLFVVCFGIDELTKVLLIAFGAGAPMCLNLFVAIRGVDQRLIEMARTTRAGSRRIVTTVLVRARCPVSLLAFAFRWRTAFSAWSPRTRSTPMKGSAS